MAPSGQHYANHTQYYPLFHYFAMPASFIFLVWSSVRFFRAMDADSLYFLVGALAIFGAVSVARMSPLRAQDRLIRLEEQLRYARLLPADLTAKAESTFAPRHYIALRFASDGELEGLVREVLASPEMKGRDIKQKIKNWRGDYFRV